MLSVMLTSRAVPVPPSIIRGTPLDTETMPLVGAAFGLPSPGSVPSLSSDLPRKEKVTVTLPRAFKEIAPALIVIPRYWRKRSVYCFQSFVMAYERKAFPSAVVSRDAMAVVALSVTAGEPSRVNVPVATAETLRGTGFAALL